ncbi:hypothetical protein [Mumia zhuanghuii]|uniref:Uncharacterized protein n=1 Tax=Mumia zhuanghuii TaxID=2585211 RepID=A0A5C4MBA9_9ACTN|nr:hypothetical protein [Mumia zhuanghuii]TNC33690.1 hypothetical protein FHE65_28495 [Mumia zhuanghuii]TNC33932.1 hypothetical protein FHE65_28345 [Mumia zhuanghuii]
MVVAAFTALVCGIGIGAVVVWWASRRDPPEPVTGRVLIPVAPELAEAQLHTLGNRPLDNVTRSEITRLLQTGRKMEAVRLLHGSTDMSLLQAKARIEEWSDAVERRLIAQAYADAADLDHAEVDEVLAEDLRAMLGFRFGRWRALKLLRRRTTMRLMDAFDYIDSLRRTGVPD